jgi:ubiquinone/menaquinone biosynthesis C-methylase UbiE
MDVEQSRKLYRRNAPVYDLVARAFAPIRTAAIATLAVRRGETVLDVGCGTGLSFGSLETCMGEEGCIIGLDQSPEMLARAERRVSQSDWRNVRLIAADATQTRLHSESVDAVLCCLAHDLATSREAMQMAASALRRGGRFVVAGVKLRSGPLSALPNQVLRATVRLGVTAPLTDRPWTALEAVLGRLDVTELYGGLAYVAAGVKGRHA